MFAFFSLLAGVGSLYLMTLFGRVVLTWFNGPSLGEPYRLLCRITDPFLNWFRRFRFLRTESYDFTPIAAMASLALVNNVFATLGHTGRITLGIILSLVLGGAWGAVSFGLSFVSIVLIAQLILSRPSLPSPSPIAETLDAVSRPVVGQVKRMVFRDRLVLYRTGVTTTLALSIGANLAGGLVVGLVSALLRALPF